MKLNHTNRPVRKPHPHQRLKPLNPSQMLFSSSSFSLFSPLLPRLSFTAFEASEQYLHLLPPADTAVKFAKHAHLLKLIPATELSHHLHSDDFFCDECRSHGTGHHYVCPTCSDEGIHYTLHPKCARVVKKSSTPIYKAAHELWINHEADLKVSSSNRRRQVIKHFAQHGREKLHVDFFDENEPKFEGDNLHREIKRRTIHQKLSLLSCGLIDSVIVLLKIHLPHKFDHEQALTETETIAERMKRKNMPGVPPVVTDNRVSVTIAENLQRRLFNLLTVFVKDFKDAQDEMFEHIDMIFRVAFDHGTFDASPLIAAIVDGNFNLASQVSSEKLEHLYLASSSNMSPGQLVALRPFMFDGSKTQPKNQNLILNHMLPPDMESDWILRTEPHLLDTSGELQDDEAVAKMFLHEQEVTNPEINARAWKKGQQNWNHLLRVAVDLSLRGYTSTSESLCSSYHISFIECMALCAKDNSNERNNISHRFPFQQMLTNMVSMCDILRTHVFKHRRFPNLQYTPDPRLSHVGLPYHGLCVYLSAYIELSLSSHLFSENDDDDFKRQSMVLQKALPMYDSEERDSGKSAFIPGLFSHLATYYADFNALFDICLMKNTITPGSAAGVADLDGNPGSCVFDRENWPQLNVLISVALNCIWSEVFNLYCDSESAVCIVDRMADKDSCKLRERDAAHELNLWLTPANFEHFIRNSSKMDVGKTIPAVDVMNHLAQEAIGLNSQLKRSGTGVVSSAEDFSLIIEGEITRIEKGKQSENELVEVSHEEVIAALKSRITIVNPKAARQYVVKVISRRNIKTWFVQEKLKRCPLPGLLPVVEQCLLFSLVHSWKLERNEIEFKEIETITEAILSDVSDILLFCTKTVPMFIRNFFEIYEPPTASAFPQELEQLHQLRNSMSVLSKTLKKLKPYCDEGFVLESHDHWFKFVSDGCRFKDKENQKNVIDFYLEFTSDFCNPQSILDQLPVFHPTAKVIIHNENAHDFLKHQTTNGFAKFWENLVFSMHKELGISQLNKDHVSTTGLVQVASAFLMSTALPAQQQLSHGINFVVRAASIIVVGTDLCASIVNHTASLFKFIFFGRDFGLSLLSNTLREIGRRTRQQGFNQVGDTFYNMGAILGSERSRLNFPVRFPLSQLFPSLNQLCFLLTLLHFQSHLPPPVYGLLHVLEHWEELPHDHESETFVSDCLTALSLIIYLAPCFTNDERDYMIQKYEHGMLPVNLKKQRFGETIFDKDSRSMIMRMQHIQASNMCTAYRTLF